MNFKIIDVKVVQLPSRGILLPMLDEMFNIEQPYVRIEGEDRIYHRSEIDELIKHIEELNTTTK